MMYRSSKILLLNKNPERAKELRSFLMEEFGEVDCCFVTQEAIKRMREEKYDLLVLANQLNDLEGTEFIRRLKDQAIHVPFIMISSNGDVKQAVEAMKLGAVDFIQWSDDKKAFFPYVVEVVKKALHKRAFDEFISEEDLIYKTLFENLRDAVFLHFIDEETKRPGFFIEVNPVACHRLGYSRHEFFLMKPEDIDVQNIVEQKKIVEQLFKKGSVIFKSLHRTKDGRKIPVEINSKIFNLKGKKAVLSIARNITDQQKILNDLKRSGTRFRAIIEESIIGICICNKNGVLEYANDAFCKIVGFPLKDISGKSISDLVHNDFKQRLLIQFNALFKTGKSKGKIELNIIDKNGNKKFLIVNTVLISDFEGDLQSVTFVEDITEERKAKEALEMSELKYRTMMEALHDPIFISDAEFNIIYANKAFKKRFGDVKDHSKCYKRVFGERKPCPWCISSIREMSNIRKRYEKTINKRVYQITTVPIQFKSSYHAKMTILRDVTKVVKARKKAEESDRLKSAFLANISHEIRTPLNVVLGFSNLLKDEQLTRDEMLMYIDMINESSAHLLQVIDNIIEFSFIDSGLVQVKPNVVDIEHLLNFLYQETRQLLEKHNKTNVMLIFENHLSEDLNFINDEVRIKQVLQNLLSNAVKFTEVGKIILRVYYDENKWVIFSVKDTGIGIPRNLQNVIFKRFRQGDEGYSRMFGGSGLGLPLCKNLAEMMGGYIKVKSNPGEGSEFKLFVPVKFDESLAKALSVDYVR